MSLYSKMRRFRRDRSGLAAVEFAFLLPVMITIFFGLVEVSAAVECRADVADIAGTAADLVAQVNTASTADISNVFNAANTILYPFYDATSQNTAQTVKPNLTIASVIDNGAADKKSGVVAWVCAQGTAAVSVGQVVNFGQPLMNTGGSVIYSVVSYNYSSPTTKVIAPNIIMGNSFYTKPRRTLQIALQSCPP